MKIGYGSSSVRGVSGGGVGAILVFGVTLLLMLEPTLAMANQTGATDQGKWAAVLQEVVKLLTGPVAKGGAVIAVVSMGFMALAGKLAWDTAIKVVLGILLIFSSVSIVSWLSTSSTGDTNATTFIQ